MHACTHLNSYGCLNPPVCVAHDDNKSTLALSLLLLSLLALAYIGVPSPSFSLYPCQCFCLSGIRGQRTSVAFVGFVCFFGPDCLAFFPIQFIHTFSDFSYETGRYRTLSSYLSISYFSLRCPHLFLLSPVFMYLWFSPKSSAPESPLDPESPWNLE